MGIRHNLEMINIFNEDATTNGNVPAGFQEIDRYEAREKVVDRLKELGLLFKIEDYTNKVGYSQRGNVPIEPYLSEQWFMKMDELCKPALQVVLDGKVKFHPGHWIKTTKTGWQISGIGAYPVNYGGDTGYRYGIINKLMKFIVK